MSNKIKINMVFNVISKLVNILFPLITAVYLARILGPENIGKVSFAQSILTYFTAFASLGIPTYGTRAIARTKKSITERDKVFSELFFLNFAATMLCSMLYLYIIYNVAKFREDINLYFCLGITLFLNIFNLDWVFSAYEEYVYMTIRSVIIKSCAIVAIFLLVKSKNDYPLYALILSLATAGNYIVNLFGIKDKVKLGIKNLEYHRHLRPIIILFVTILATDLYNQIDITMLGILRTEYEVGIYSNGIKIIRMIYSITAAISATILPQMSVLFEEKQEERFNELFQKTMDLLLLFSIPSMIGLLSLSDVAVFVLFGESFLETASIIDILSPLIVVISLSYLYGSIVLTATNNERYLLIATVLGAMVNILLNSAMIPRFGGLGAAIASVASELVVFVVHFSIGKKYISYKVNKAFLLSILTSSGVMYIVVLMLKKIIKHPMFSLTISMLLGIGTFALIIFVTNKNIFDKIGTNYK